jgi:hypothetical protein
MFSSLGKTSIQSQSIFIVLFFFHLCTLLTINIVTKMQKKLKANVKCPNAEENFEFVNS